MAVLTVGAGLQYAAIALAIAAAQDGDVVHVQSGTYVNDIATVNARITLQGVGGMVKLVANGDIANGKGILVTNTDVTIDHFEFSGATVADANGAGVRYQGGNLVITNSYFHDNQNGVLANPDATGTITIASSEFSHNGSGDGYTHNLYVGAIAKLTVTDSYFHDAVIGHQIKSRAAETVIANNRIYDNSGTSSYSIDLPNGGRATLTGNVIQQGLNGVNPIIISFGEEGGLHPASALAMAGDTIVNDMGRGTLIRNVGGAPVRIADAKVFGLAAGQLGAPESAFTGTIYLRQAPVLDRSSPTGPPVDPAPAPEAETPPLAESPGVPAADAPASEAPPPN